MPDSTVHNERELLLRIAEGNQHAFAKLFDSYSGNVKHVARMFTQSESMAEDIVQDVFMKIWLKREDLKSIVDFKNWLFIVAKNFSINALNKISREVKYETLPDYLPVHDNSNLYLDEKYLEKYIRQAMQQLTEQQQKVFELSKLQGFNREEISEILGLSPNTVKMHLVRSTRFIRAFLLARIGLAISGLTSVFKFF